MVVGCRKLSDQLKLSPIDRPVVGFDSVPFTVAASRNAVSST